MEKREQVFVSSTYVDLVDERHAVIHTLLQADCIPSGMELFPASDDDSWTLITRVIDDCDYYIVVIGARYGSVHPDKGVSFTEMEFDYAVETGKPVMGFLHGDPGSIPSANAELTEDAQKALKAFREKVKQRNVKYWTSPADLSGQVALSLIQIRKTRPAEGWVRASNALTPEVEKELAELRARVAELTQDLERQEHHSSTIIGLAEGSEQVELEVSATYWTWEDKDSGAEPLDLRSGALVVSTSWDEVFADVAPKMMHECTEEALEKSVSARCLRLAREQEEESDPRVGYFYSTVIGETSFDDVKVQFSALGLIEPSTRKHAPSDTNTYWTLTHLGQARMHELRAIRKSAAT